MLSALQNNPYRYIGVYTNSQAKEFVANLSRIKAFCKVGKDINFPSDLDAVLPRIERSEQMTEEMANKINLPKDKLRYALTWFINASDNDASALRQIQAGLLDQAMAQLYKVQDYSSIINRGVTSFLMEKDIEGLKYILQVIHDTEYRQQFVKAVCGPTFSVPEQELAEMFIDELHQDIPALILSRMLRQKEIPQRDLDYVNEIITGKADAYIHGKLNSFRSDSASITEAKQLLEDCAPYLANLREAQGKNGVKYLRLSTQVEQTVLNVVIQDVNTRLNNLKTPTSYIEQITIKSELLNKLAFAWFTISMLDKLDVDSDAKNRLARQLDSLRSLFRQLDVSVPSMADFQLMTERDLFEACYKREHFENYIKRFPLGDFTKKALAKIEELKKKEKEEREQLTQRIDQCQTVEEASDLLVSCNDEESRKLIDDKYFSLCQTRADFRSYLQDFEDRGRHVSEAQSHLRIELAMKKIRAFLSNNLWWTIGIIAALVLIAFQGIINGYEGLASSFIIIGVAFAILAFYKMRLANESGNGCAPVFVTAAIAICSFILSGVFKSCQKQQIKEQEELLAFNILMREPSQYQCEAFISQYPESERKEQVMAIYYGLANQEGLEGLTAFFNNYAGTSWGDKANQRRKEMCDSLYDIALTEGTVSGWRNYQQTVPTDFLADSQEKIDSLENIRWKTDDMAWNAAQDDNTMDSYQKYLNLYPKGKHKKEADKKIIDAQVNDIMAGDHGSLAGMDRVSYGTGITSTVSVNNNTSYTMTLLYSGPDSKRLVLSPHQTGSVTLKNGTYRVAASVTDASVRNYAGTETLQGGGYSVEYYISTTTIPRFSY